DKLTAMSLSNGSARLCHELCKIPGTVLLHSVKKRNPQWDIYVPIRSDHANTFERYHISVFHNVLITRSKSS
ncbi:MAG: hypothetical protein JW882_15810, partial [Deltaproteobacteria bacterium]|nr:hypothetical protein [Deltaproteobacteria bacterium]